MEVSSSHQMYVFALCILSGILCGIFFDLQRFWRQIRFAGYARTLFEDILFAALCIGITIGFGFYFNNGEIRYYQIMGSISGALLYAALLSRYVMRLFHLVYKLLLAVVVTPLVKICRLLIFPVKKIVSRFKKAAAKIKKKFSRVTRNVKTVKKRLKKRIKML